MKEDILSEEQDENDEDSIQQEDAIIMDEQGEEDEILTERSAVEEEV